MPHLCADSFLDRGRKSKFWSHWNAQNLTKIQQIFLADPETLFPFSYTGRNEGNQICASSEGCEKMRKWTSIALPRISDDSGCVKVVLIPSDRFLDVRKTLISWSQDNIASWKARFKTFWRDRLDAPTCDITFERDLPSQISKKEFWRSIKREMRRYHKNRKWTKVEENHKEWIPFERQHYLRDFDARKIFFGCS